MIDLYDLHCQLQADTSRPLLEEIAGLRQQLAAAQAVIADLKSEISLIAKTAGSRPIRDMAKEVLEREHDDTVLREMLAEQWEKAASLCEKSDRYRGDYFAAILRAEAEKIHNRSLIWMRLY